MRNITVIVDVNGKTDVTTQLIGYSGEHNAVSLEVGFTEEGLSLYSAADYFRIVIDGFYSEKLFLNQDNTVQYNLPQEVMKPPKVNCQLLGYKGDESEINLILKSEVFSFQVDCSEVPFQKIDKGQDYFEEALHLCTTAAESAGSFCESASEFCETAQNSAKSASIYADTAVSNSIESGRRASDAAVAAQRAERAAESLNVDNLSNALKGNKAGSVVSLKDVSLLPHSVNIQLENADSSSGINGSQTVIDEISVGTNESGAYNWSDVAPDNIFRVSIPNEGVNRLKIKGLFKKIAIAPIVDGQIELGENAEVHWIDYSLFDEMLYLTAEFSIVDGVLNWEFGMNYDGHIEDYGVWEGGSDSYETALSENQKITGVAIKTVDPENSWASFSAEVLIDKDIPVKVCGKNLFDKSKSLLEGIRNETAVGVKATKIIEHNAIVQCLKPNIEYTLSYEIECLSIPEDATLREQAVGLMLRVKGGSTIVPIKYKSLKVGDVLNYTSTFTLTEEQYNSGTIEMLAYGNAYLGADGKTELYPMVVFRNIQIEEGTTATEYEPFVEPTTYTADADGSLTVPSIYPSMTVYTKNNDINVNIQYNRDINKAFKTLIDAVILLGGTVND